MEIVSSSIVGLLQNRICKLQWYLRQILVAHQMSKYDYISLHYLIHYCAGGDIYLYWKYMRHISKQPITFCQADKYSKLNFFCTFFPIYLCAVVCFLLWIINSVVASRVILSENIFSTIESKKECNNECQHCSMNYHLIHQDNVMSIIWQGAVTNVKYYELYMCSDEYKIIGLFIQNDKITLTSVYRYIFCDCCCICQFCNENCIVKLLLEFVCILCASKTMYKRSAIIVYVAMYTYYVVSIFEEWKRNPYEQCYLD